MGRPPYMHGRLREPSCVCKEGVPLSVFPRLRGRVFTTHPGQQLRVVESVPPLPATTWQTSGAQARQEWAKDRA